LKSLFLCKNVLDFIFQILPLQPIQK
jgi:hypothetical protein